MIENKSILIVGDYSWPWYQEACGNALNDLGFQAEKFSWFDDFRYRPEGAIEPVYKNLWLRLQYRFNLGPKVREVEKRLIKQALDLRPNFIWFYNVRLISPNTVKQLRQKLPNTKFIQYANDNPFVLQAKYKFWSNFIKSIPYFDLTLSYRKNNLEAYKQHGAKHVELLRSYFIPENDYPLPISKIPKRFKCDIVFAGHYENDGRLEILEEVCNKGYSLNLFGGGWNEVLLSLDEDNPLKKYYPVSPVIGDEYRYAICGAKVALCFLSALNHDTYTRRNFQIPAMKTVMLSQYTSDLEQIFTPNSEAFFFRNTEELFEQLDVLIPNDGLRDRVREAGYKKVYSGHHHVEGRMRELSKIINEKNNIV